MCKLIALTMGVLLQEDGRNRAIEDKVTAVKQDLLHRLPSLNARATSEVRLLRFVWIVAEGAFIVPALVWHKSTMLGEVLLFVAEVALVSRVVISAVS